MMTKTSRYLSALFEDCEYFPYIFDIDGFVFILGGFCNLSSFISPSIRRRGNEIRLDYDIGITVINDENNQKAIFIENIKSKNYVMLPQVVHHWHSDEMMIIEGKISDWALQNIKLNLSKYCLDNRRARRLVNSEDDQLISNMKEVYADEFSNLIVKPLQS